MTSRLTLRAPPRRLLLQFLQWGFAWDCTAGLFFGALKIPLLANKELSLSRNAVFFLGWAGNRFHRSVIGTIFFWILGAITLFLLKACNWYQYKQQYLILEIFWISFLWLPVTRLSSGQLKHQNSQRFLLRRYVTWNCDTLQKYSAHKIDGLGHAQYSSKKWRISNNNFTKIQQRKSQLVIFYTVRDTGKIPCIF